MYVFYGFDMYMGGNLVEFLCWMMMWDDEDIKAMYSAYDREIVKAFLFCLKYFNDGMCMVYDMFGEDVCNIVCVFYGDVY